MDTELMAVSDSGADAPWFALNTRPRHKTTVAGGLELRGMEGFLIFYPCQRPFGEKSALKAVVSVGMRQRFSAVELRGKG